MGIEMLMTNQSFSDIYQRTFEFTHPSFELSNTFSVREVGSKIVTIIKNVHASCINFSLEDFNESHAISL